MRILFVTNTYTPYSGGVISSIVTTTEELRNQGHDVHIISLKFLSRHDDPEYVTRIYCPIRFMYKKNHMAIPWMPYRAVHAAIVSYRPDIIHIHHPFFLGRYAAYNAHIYGIPSVFTYHTLYEEYSHYVPMPFFIMRPLISLLVNNFCTLVDGIIAPSSSIYTLIRKKNILIPIEIIPSPLKRSFLTTSETSAVDSTYFDLLFVGRFAKEKNIPFVLEVCQLLPPCVRLTLIGYGKEYESLRSLAFNTLHISCNRVRFIYKPTQEELMSFYKTSHLFIFPSRSDTQGIVLGEALSQGLPVVALDGPGQRDIISNGINGFIIENAQDAVSVILTIINNPDLYNTLVKGALLSSQRFHPYPLTNKLLSFYNTIINNKSYQKNSVVLHNKKEKQ
jgi:glycosyltransferase involved in cell wall biosynthesis